MNMNPDFFPRNLSLAHNLIKTEPGKDDGKRKDKNRIPGLLQQSKINEEDLTPEERERRERERRLNSKPTSLLARACFFFLFVLIRLKLFQFTAVCSKKLSAAPLDDKKLKLHNFFQAAHYADLQ